MSRLTPADDLAIRDLVHEYADATTHRDPDRWGACFAEDAVWDLGRAKAEGREAIVRLYTRAMGNQLAVTQTVHNGANRAGTDANHAAGRWYIEEKYRLADGTPGVLGAHYDDEYVRDAGGDWRFARRTLTIQYAGPPDLSAEFLNTRDGLRAAGESPGV